jgi:hypothetical protein
MVRVSPMSSSEWSCRFTGEDSERGVRDRHAVCETQLYYPLCSSLPSLIGRAEW